MKCKATKALNTNLSLFLLIIYLILIFEINSTTKSFMEIAQEEFTKQDYLSESYRKEAASLNPEYYTKKGIEELDKCRNTFLANYNRCTLFTTCNFCSANSDCGWCDEKKICIPVEPDTRNDNIVPVCQGECIRVLKIEYCYKGLFEPENTQGEVNFANYKEVLTPEPEEDSENIFEKALEKNFYEQRTQNFKFKELDKDCGKDKKPKIQKFKVNDSRLNFDPNANFNKPLTIDMNKHSQQLYKDMTNLSKGIFSQLVGEKVLNKKPTSLIKIVPDIKTQKEKVDDLMKEMKESIPNFEFPQFLKSDLEGSIDQIKKEKLLLWLRGYSLNDPLSKQHLPIYKNINFDEEEKDRKQLLDTFYDNFVKDPTKKINSQVYKNIMGKETLTGESINAYKNNAYRTTKKKESIDDLKSEHVINSNYMERNALKNMVKQNNMRFKEKDVKSFKDISKELKDYLESNKNK